MVELQSRGRLDNCGAGAVPPFLRRYFVRSALLDVRAGICRAVATFGERVARDSRQPRESLDPRLQ